jgi:hypothetical protein
MYVRHACTPWILFPVLTQSKLRAVARTGRVAAGSSLLATTHHMSRVTHLTPDVRPGGQREPETRVDGHSSVLHSLPRDKKSREDDNISQFYCYTNPSWQDLHVSGRRGNSDNGTNLLQPLLLCLPTHFPPIPPPKTLTLPNIRD